MVNCIFNCEGVKCSTSDAISFENIICSHHLALIFGLITKVQIFEPEKCTELSGPWLIPDIHFSFPPNTVIFPEKDFLDQFLIPQKVDIGTNYLYKLNPRIQSFINDLNMKKIQTKDQKIARYFIEILRNLCEKAIDEINLIDESDYTHVDLKKTVQNRLNNTFTHIKNEPYYHLFKNFEVISISESEADGNVKKISLEELSPIYGFFLFNCLYSEHDMPTNLTNVLPLRIYGNLVYKKGIGIVTMDEIKNGSFLVVYGKCAGTNAYYQMKCFSEPKTVKSNNNLSRMFYPDNQRNLNVISSNDRYCRY